MQNSDYLIHVNSAIGLNYYPDQGNQSNTRKYSNVVLFARIV